VQAVPWVRVVRVVPWEQVVPVEEQELLTSRVEEVVEELVVQAAP
jgi:hypothetical protein